MFKFPAYAQCMDTLSPGQTISVNKYTVQVERCLSQGDFAHVYLVRTPTPIYNTTHHVLKQIAAANERMLAEVKKEADVMRLLKGHPNIVHFIGASWRKLPNGSFEAFILMEYCPGGGILDMMNRCLPKRLTEAKILQIFLDVCEGVAYMHNSRPPLLHRDLKLENILQSSPASFKLCDFGHATTISNPPANMQEILALEADLTKHTTLEYRAPEMVDVYSKRPINEKSDVWALGVLLCKLCYYTAPFEEHGALATLNVQYRIPSYPSYSPDMHMLIAFMLRENGAQRPTAYELLAHVHHMRGSKSKFTNPVRHPLLPRYSIPLNNSTGGPAHDAFSKQGGLKKHRPETGAHLATFIQAPEKVLETIAPMHRGQPTYSKENSSQQVAGSNWMDCGFGTEENQAWTSEDDDWNDFAHRLWITLDPNSASATGPEPTATSTVIPTPLAFTGSRKLRTKRDRIIPNDAFDDLELTTTIFVKPSPTLGEARKLRTELAVAEKAERINESKRLSAHPLQDSDFVPRKSQTAGLVPPLEQELASPTTNLTPGFASKSPHRPQVSNSTQPPLKPSSSPAPSTSHSIWRYWPSFNSPNKLDSDDVSSTSSSHRTYYTTTTSPPLPPCPGDY